MKKSISIPVIAVSIAIAIGGMVFGMKANTRCQAVEQEALKLREQIGQMQSSASETKKPESANPDQAALIDTNTIAQFEAELTALRAELADAKKNRPSPREGWQERMARMKEEDPEGYDEMIRQREERRNAMRYDLAERTANFMDLDAAFMTDAERENHDFLIEKMADVWALTEQFQDPEQQPNRETMRKLFGAINEARPLMDAERNTMFRKLANDLGFDGEEAQAFSGYVEDIISATTIQPPRTMGPGRFPGSRTE